MTSPDSTIPPSAWEFFDKIYCISLESRPDRRDEARRQFATVALGDKVEYLIVHKNLADQVEGIFTSHMLCLQQGLAAGAHHILIFEDDILFRGFDGHRLQQACLFLQDTSQWRAFFLGCMTNGSTKTDTPSLRRIRYRCLAHAYAINRPFAELLVRESWAGIPFDELLRRRQDEFYALHPMCAFQGLAGSDNRTFLLDRLRTLFGGLPFLQKSNELYQNHKAIILSLHFLIAACVIALLARQFLR